MDYSNLRAAALRNAEDEEAVTVDTRALIDKVLARYSGEWTTLRELIQNAADAQATSVTVTWETLPSTSVPMPNTTDRSDQLKHVIANHTLRRLVVSNDGQPFNQKDWARLKRIAEGNPDETKIGAFGVGFYSVFADCEEPFVSSGSEAMAFYWKGNSLFTKKSKLPEEQSSNSTTFVLDYRNTTTPMPNLLSVCQFLATSLTFVALQNMEFKIDEYTILSLKKKTSPVVDLSLPRDLVPLTKEGLMKVVGVGRTSTQIDASFMSVIGWKPQSAASKAAESFNPTESSSSLRNFFSRLTAKTASGTKSRAAAEESKAQSLISEDVTKVKTSSIFLRATSADVQTSVTSSFASELERATKKPPPSKTRLSILTASFDEAAASQAASVQDGTGDATDVFASVLPNKKPGGRIFIGFPTMQTTGAGMHLSAPSVIPTVEREAIDLNARWVRTWNVELLRAAGIIVRLAFANEMADLHKKAMGSVGTGIKVTEEIIFKYLPEALHILGTYTFAYSTPSPQVGQIMEEAFWTCFKKASIEMYSTRGVLQTSEVRLGIDELNSFVDSIPVVPKQISDAPFVKKLIDFGLLSPINVGDIKKELEVKALSKVQVISLITWLGKKTMSGELDPGSRSALLDVAVAAVEEGGSGEVIALGSITNYHSLARIPANMPIPSTTIPFSFIIKSTPSELQALGWEPLEIVPWLRFLIETSNSRSDDESFTKSAKVAVQVLIILSKNWDTLSNASRNTVTSLVQNRTVMPTKLGMKYPTESFFQTVKLFDDLPVIQGCEKVKEKFLVAIGVRKTLDLETIFTRLLNTPEKGGQQKWSHMELIKYLTSVQADIPSADMKKLGHSKICPAEAGPKGMEPTKGTDVLYKVSELFEPQAALRALNLPILQWPGPPGSYRTNSAEALFLKNLGLRTFPSVPELVEMMASKDATLRANAMTYFITNHHMNMYGAFDLSTCRKSILPLKESSELVMPSACFTNPRVTVLGFSVLRQDLHDHAHKFGVARDPPMLECVSRLLAKPPQDHQSAVTVFGYFASRLSELGDMNVARIRNAAIVPITHANNSVSVMKEKRERSVTFITPRQTYLGSSPTYEAIFDFVDFGNDANAFLFKCGARNEPTKLEVAEMASSEPTRLLSALGSIEKYLNLLKSLAEESHSLQKNKALWGQMRSAKFLPAYKEASTPTKENLIDFEDEVEPVKEYQFASAGQVVVVDDIVSHRLFKDHLLCAPEEDLLEDFYIQLGAHKLSAMVEEDLRIGGRATKDSISQHLRKHVIERSKLFLHEYTNYRRDVIKHDAKWLESNLLVEVVRSVALRRTLKGQSQSHIERRSAAGSHTRGAWILYVADDSKPDMYQVGQALCQMLLKRPNQHAYLFFEPFLTLDLYALRDRGHNVDRILRVKAAEARMAEEEKRKVLEEQKIMREREVSQATRDLVPEPAAGMIPEPVVAEAARSIPSTPAQSRPSLPGAWSSPEDNAREPASTGKKSRGLFSDWTKRLGFDSQPGEQPPPYSASGQQEKETYFQGSSNGGMDTGEVTSPTVVQQNLANAVNATRAHDSNSLFSQPKVNEVKEQATYCDASSGNDLQHVDNAPNGLKVYTARQMSVDSQQFLADYRDAVHSFAILLVDLAQVYGLSSKVLHIYYDEKGNTIAFNTGGSIFCNLRFFLQLHAPKISPQDGGAAWADAATWWWVVIAHELAHNLVGPHNASHSYYTEAFIQQYMSRMLTKISQRAPRAQ